MRRTTQRPLRRRRALLSAAALGTVLAVGAGALIATPALAAPNGSQTGVGTNKAGLTPTLTVSPGYEVNPDGDTTLTLTGTGYATETDYATNFGGAYLLFGVISPKDTADTGSWAPSKRGVSGTNYDYAAGAGTYQSLINYPGNTTEPDLDYMDADGDWTTTLQIPGARFTSQAGNEIDCSVQQCGVITIGAHGQLSSGVEVFTPVTFASENWEATAPTFTAGPSDTTVEAGEDATFSVTVTGDPEPALQWQSRTAGGSWSDIAGATSASLTVEAVTEADDAREYRVLASNEAATGVTSDTATLTVESATPEYPEGAAVGTPLEGNASYIVITPGEDIDGSGSVTFTLDGYGFDPGPVVTPGTGSGGIYVGFGTKKDTTSAETWRRSKGGISGPQSSGDYTYGSPIFVANQGTGDADVADGVMDADGTWTATLTIPGSSVPSFFGDTIDCTAVDCGVFSFGAHGVVKAANEAYTAVSFAEPVVPATPTTTTLAAQSTATPTIVGTETTLSATVDPATAEGTVEFLLGGTSLGESDVTDGVATLATTPTTGGAQQLTAVFTPSDDALFEASTSAERTFRFVDLTPAVDTITVGSAVSEITDGTLNWSVANYYSSILGSGFSKAVISGDVALSELPTTATGADRAKQEFIFSGGTGTTDAAGNAQVAFTGSVKVTSGSSNTWTFTDPEVFTNAAGAGYITAEVTTDYAGSVQGPTRVVVSTFTGAQAATTDAVTSFEVAPVFADQFAAGTWSGSFTGGAFTNQVLTMMNSGVRSFFYQSGSSADASKSAGPIGLSYTNVEIAAPSLVVDPATGLDRAGAVISVSGTSIDTSARPSYDPSNPAGVYVSLGWISNDGWKPSEGAATSTRVAVSTKWVQQATAAGGDYVQWTTGTNGRASFSFDFDSISYADALAKKPATGDYRLAVYSIGAGGVVQAVNETAYDVAFVPAAATTVTLAAQSTGDFPTDFAGADVTLSATVTPAVAGTVEFLSDGVSLGQSAVSDGSALLATTAFTGGAHQVTVSFTPDDAVLYAESTSAERTFRIVDLARAVDDIVVGDAVEQIADATFDWSIANYWSSAGYEFSKEAASGNVTVPEAQSGDRQFNSNRLFTFTDGTGYRDAEGNTVIDFTAVARVGSGTASQWNFTDPQILIDVNGNGYVTAVFDGYFTIEGMADYQYGPQRVTIATFTGAEQTVGGDTTSFTVTPMWEGQAAAGTWVGSNTGSFPTEFTSLLYSGIRSFFYQSGASADGNKPVQPITVEYVAGTAPAVTAQPSDAAAVDGENVSFQVAVSGAPTPSVQWQTLQDGEWIDVDGATSATLTLTGVATGADGAQYRAVVTNMFGQVETDAATLSVSPIQPTFVPDAPVIGDEDQGGFEIVSIDDRSVTVRVPAELVNTWVGVTFHSDPVFLGWELVGRDQLIEVIVPADAYGEHHLSFVSADDEALGWLSLTLPAASTDDGQSGEGQSTGDNGSSSDTQGAAAAGGTLPLTGGGLPLLAGGAALLLLLSGALLIAARRRGRAHAE